MQWKASQKHETCYQRHLCRVKGERISGKLSNLARRECIQDQMYLGFLSVRRGHWKADNWIDVVQFLTKHLDVRADY